MRTFDIAPLYRSAIGFDRLINMLDENRLGSEPGYPPYNIELVDENKYRISMAVAGFAEAELDIEVEGESLKVIGQKQKQEAKRTYLHQGIAARNFERRFQLADHVKVTGANLENGLLHIELQREIPEALKPRKVDIASTDSTKIVN